MKTSFKLSGKLFEVMYIDEINQLVTAKDVHGNEYVFTLDKIDFWIS